MIQLHIRDGRTIIVEDERADRIAKLKEQGIRAVMIDGEKFELTNVTIGKKVRNTSTMSIMMQPPATEVPKRESNREWPFRVRRYVATRDKRYNDLSVSLKELEAEYGREYEV